MATVAILQSLFNTTAGNKTTTAATTTTSDLIVVVAAASGTSLANAATTAVSDNASGTYTKVADSGSIATSSPRITIWIRDSLVASGASTTFTATQANSSGGGLIVYRVSGMTRTGLYAARAAGSAFSDSTTQTPAVTLWTPALTGNAMIGGVVNSTSPAGLTPPTSWTEDTSPAADLGYSTPTTGLEACYRSSGHTSATTTWGGTSASAYRACVVELDTSTFTNRKLALSGVG